MGKVRPVRNLRDCKQRSLTVSKKAPNVSKKASPVKKPPFLATPEKGALREEIPVPIQGATGKMGNF